MRLLRPDGAMLDDCVRFDALPDVRLPSDATSLYNSSASEWTARVKKARTLLRRQHRSNFSLSSAVGLTSAAEVRAAHGGIILVGDSQVRELAWAILKALTPFDELRFGNDGLQLFSEGKTEAARLRSRRRLRGACLPQTVGKLGFTAVCSRVENVCRLYSPFRNGSHMERLKQLWLFKPQQWSGELSVSPHVCDADVSFFIHYQCIWGAVPILPDSVPACVRHAPAQTRSRVAGGPYGLLASPMGSAPSLFTSADQTPAVTPTTMRPLLWVASGSGLHEMETCDPSIAADYESDDGYVEPRAPRTPPDEGISSAALQATVRNQPPAFDSDGLIVDRPTNTSQHTSIWRSPAHQQPPSNP